MTDSEPDSFFCIAQTPLSFSIRVTVAYWNIITQIKHPIMNGQEAAVQEICSLPHHSNLSGIHLD